MVSVSEWSLLKMWPSACNCGRSSAKCFSQKPGLSGWWLRFSALVHTQRISGFTSQRPSSRTPPQGPLRSVFGHVIGQVQPVECSTH